MADYHAILKRAIGALPEPTGEARRAVYEKARAALVTQLKSFDPPLSASEITQQRLQLEDAIRRVEGEAAKGILAQSLNRAVTGATAPTGLTSNRPAPPTARPAAPTPRPAAPTARTLAGPTEGRDRQAPEPRPETRPEPPAAPTTATPARPAPPRPPVPGPIAARPAPTPPTSSAPARTATTAPGPSAAPATGAPTPAATAPTAGPAVRPSRPTITRTPEPVGRGSMAEPIETTRPAPTGFTRAPSRAASVETEPTSSRSRFDAAVAPPPPPADLHEDDRPAPTPPTGGVERKRLSLKEIARPVVSIPARTAPPAAPPPPPEEHEAAITDADMVGYAVDGAASPAAPAPDPDPVEPDYPEEAAAPAVPEVTPEPAPTGRTKGRKGRRADPDPLLEPEKPKRMPLIVGLSVAALVVAVGTVALWTKRDQVAAYFGTERLSGGTGQRPSSEKTLTPKVTDRLAPEDGTNPGRTAANAQNGVKVVTTQPITATPSVQSTTGATGQPAGAGQPAAGGSDAGGRQTVAAAPSGGTAVVPGGGAANVPPIAQKAQLLEEGAGGSTQNQISSGRVIWQTVRESPGAGKPAVTMIKARVEVPDRGLVLNLSIQPNSDNSFPASHLIELKFEVPADFDNKGVSNVPGLILKQTETARGDPLVGAAARISAGFFWIALSAPEAEKQRNLGLLKERGWIDIPILFDNGKRGILTLEKSGAGDRVVADALTAWAQGG